MASGLSNTPNAPDEVRIGVSLYSVLAEEARESARGETALTRTKETLDNDQEERDHWLLLLSD
jgi:hypothetical protein